MEKGIRVDSFTKAQRKALVLIVCVALTSCGPTRTQRTAESPAHVENKPLSAEQILAVANAAAQERGWPLAALRVILDEDNAYWKSRGMSKLYIPELEGRDFQVVIYRRRQAMIAEDCVVVVDKNTGEVLLVLG